jgi:hypothetical protein
MFHMFLILTLTLQLSILKLTSLEISILFYFSILVYSLFFLLSISVLISLRQMSEDENGLLDIQLEDLVGMIQNTQKSRRFLPLNILIFCTICAYNEL